MVAVRGLLLAALPAGTWVLSGLTLPCMSGDIDLLVVGAMGASVLEVKSWAGHIVCGPNGHAWARTRSSLVETLSDPASQLEGELRALTSFRQRRGCGMASVMGGLLVFAHPRCQLEVVTSPCQPHGQPAHSTSCARSRPAHYSRGPSKRAWSSWWLPSSHPAWTSVWACSGDLA